MSRTRFKLTPQIEKDIVSFIVAGGFPHVAAEAAGIPQEVFERWCRKGEKPDAAPRYRAFALAVRKAIAQARLGAEVEVRKQKPLDWLRSGPGRETAERPGWTANARPRPTAAASQPSVFDDPRAMAFLTMIMDEINLTPEQRMRVAELASKSV